MWNGGEPTLARLRPPGEAEEASARKKVEEADDTAADDMAAAGFGGRSIGAGRGGRSSLVQRGGAAHGDGGQLGQR